MSSVWARYGKHAYCIDAVLNGTGIRRSNIVLSRGSLPGHEGNTISILQTLRSHCAEIDVFHEVLYEDVRFLGIIGGLTFRVMHG